MFNNILEISKRTSKGGRVPIKIALLKIHKDEKETNRNGLHWKLEYVQNAIDSVKMMPICAAFCDDNKAVPLDHGLTGEEVDENGVHEPLFLNSETVGCFEEGKIEDITVNGEEITALVANGYLYNQRYPAFVKWVRENYATGTVDTSVELMGLDVNDNKIIYEEDKPTDIFRTPKIFSFSGSSIISVAPADQTAIVLEVAQKLENNKEEQDNMDFNMDEVKSVIKSTITELNSKENESNAKISELNEQIIAKDTVIAEKENVITELNASIDQLKTALDKMKADHETYWAERELLEKELVKAKVAEKIGELNASLSEFKESEIEVAKEDIEELRKNINACEKKDELNNVTTEINSIKSKICMDIVAKQKAAESAAKVTEQNTKNKKVDIEDIFSEVCTEEETDDSDVNIF
ncbi:MAG: hypothetical protein LUH21_03980 [Clostridiales bacterium]|nr:hypothetical protein [Clostridiales bacterium]